MQQTMSINILEKHWYKVFAHDGKEVKYLGVGLFTELEIINNDDPKIEYVLM